MSSDIRGTVPFYRNWFPCGSTLNISTAETKFDETKVVLLICLELHSQMLLAIQSVPY